MPGFEKNTGIHGLSRALPGIFRAEMPVKAGSMTGKARITRPKERMP
jgi:hypothetical protein